MTPALRVAYRDLVIYRRIWRANLVGSVFQPLMYLLGVGLGVGSLVDSGAGSNAALGGVSYLAFYASAIMATTAMFTSSQESLWPAMDGFKWSNAYRAMVATPVEPADVALGLGVYHAVRAGIGAVGVALVLLVFDDTRSFGLLAAIPAAVLTGLAFAMPLTAWTSTRDTDHSFPAIMRFVIIPMFLFGGVFYPIDQLPDWLEPLAWVTPLFHGVELCRGATLGTWTLGGTLVHLAVLLVFVVGGTVVAMRTFTRALRP